MSRRQPRALPHCRGMALADSGAFLAHLAHLAHLALSFVLHSFNNNADLRGSSLAFSSFAATVPEPQSLALLLLELGGAGLAMRRRGARAARNTGPTGLSVC